MRLFLYFLLLCQVAFATPTVSWYRIERFPVAGQYYAIQARGEDASGHLASVFVWRDNVPYAFNGGGDGFSNVTDHNVYVDAPGAIHLFKAQATDSFGRQSPIIYWMTKSGGTKFRYYDLPSIDTKNKLFPNLGERRSNALLFQEVAESLKNSSQSIGIMFDGNYEFDTNAGRGPNFNPNQLLSFENVSNLTISGVGVNGKTVLKWASFDDGGNLTEPHDLFRFERDCSNIVIENLTFDTFYDRRYIDGSHVKYRGDNLYLVNCWMTRSPGFAVRVFRENLTANGFPTNINLVGLRVYDTWSDGLHVDAAKKLNISHCYLTNTGDDAIALIGENGTSDPMSEDFRIDSNTIRGAGWRGIAVHKARGSESNRSTVSFNDIDGTASSAIEITPYDSADGARAIVPFPSRPIWINLFFNKIKNAGKWPAHNGAVVKRGTGFQLIACVNLIAAYNEIDGVSNVDGSYAYRLRNPLYAFVGFSDAIYNKGVDYFALYYGDDKTFLYVFNSRWIFREIPTNEANLTIAR